MRWVMMQCQFAGHDEHAQVVESDLYIPKPSWITIGKQTPVPREEVRENNVFKGGSKQHISELLTCLGKSKKVFPGKIAKKNVEDCWVPDDWDDGTTRRGEGIVVGSICCWRVQIAGLVTNAKVNVLFEGFWYGE
jgi:hypothetical protein